jgi:pSer/pThr/pTyr-binding forkhead associated (FHA) protein
MSEPVRPGTGGLGRAQEIRSASGGGGVVSIHGPWAKPVVLTQGSAYQIGRLPKNDMILEGPTVSRHHATIVWAPEAERPTIEDLASANGTIVNGVVVKAGEPRALTDGAVIDIGEHKLGVGGPAPGAKPKAKTSATPPATPRPVGESTEATAVPPGSTKLSSGSQRLSRPTERNPRPTGADSDSRHDGIGYVSFSNKKGK